MGDSLCTAASGCCTYHSGSNGAFSSCTVRYPNGTCAAETNTNNNQKSSNDDYIWGIIGGVGGACVLAFGAGFIYLGYRVNKKKKVNLPMELDQPTQASFVTVQQMPDQNMVTVQQVPGSVVISADNQFMQPQTQIIQTIPTMAIDPNTGMPYDTVTVVDSNGNQFSNAVPGALVPGFGTGFAMDPSGGQGQVIVDSATGNVISFVDTGSAINSTNVGNVVTTTM